MNRRFLILLSAAVGVVIVTVVPTVVVRVRQAAQDQNEVGPQEPPSTTTTTTTTPPTDLSVLAPIAAPPTLAPLKQTSAPTSAILKPPVVTTTPTTNNSTALTPTSVPISSPTTAPTMPALLVSPPVIVLRLVYAPTSTELIELTDGAVINVADLGVPSADFNIRAVPTDDTVTAVQFLQTGRTEATEPWAFCGDNAGDYTTCSELQVGMNSVTVLPQGPNGIELPAVSMTFEIVGTGPADSIIDGPYAEGRWIEIDSDASIDERHEACFVMVNQKAYLVGGRGTKALDIFDPVTRTWSTGETPPIQMHHMQCVAAQGKLWIVAAWTQWYPKEENPEFAYVYNPQTDSWSTRTALPVDRRRGAAAVIVSNDESKIYVSHGNNGGHETGDHAESLGYLDEYDIASDTWRALSDDAPNPRDHTGGALIDGRICVAGGRNGGELGWPEVGPTDCFDLATGQWTEEAPIPNPRAGSSYGTTCDGKLMVAGGEGGGKAWDTVEVFDGQGWSTMDSLVVGRHGSGLAVDCVCDTITIASGAAGQGGGPEIRSVEMYFPNGLDTTC